MKNNNICCNYSDVEVSKGYQQTLWDFLILNPKRFAQTGYYLNSVMSLIQFGLLYWSMIMEHEILIQKPHSRAKHNLNDNNISQLERGVTNDNQN